MCKTKQSVEKNNQLFSKTYGGKFEKHVFNKWKRSLFIWQDGPCSITFITSAYVRCLKNNKKRWHDIDVLSLIKIQIILN